LCELKNVLQIATGNFTGVLDPAIIDRIDHIITFHLPTLAQRREILRQKVQGLAGERVLEELAAATEGWSGRRLAKIVMQAYLVSTARTRAEMTAADFLRAVGLTPDPLTSVEEAVQPAAQGETIGKEDEGWQSASGNRYPQEAYPHRIKLLKLWRRFATPQAS
jgi:SpoVK/Ycf46/Vps4 family AAA+-type ATPase